MFVRLRGILTVRFDGHCSNVWQRPRVEVKELLLVNFEELTAKFHDFRYQVFACNGFIQSKLIE